MSEEELNEPELQADPYAQHLAAVNEQNPVRAASDVYSVHGVLVARAGTAIDYETARKIVRHKLLMPLDRSISLSSTVSSSGLLRCFRRVLDRFTDIRAIHHNLGFESIYAKAATRFDLPNIVAQKLTVMGIRQPTLMDQSLLVSWLGCLIGTYLGLEEKELPLIHLAAISRDMGLLHVQPDILERPTGHLFSAEEWRALRSHVVASHMILKECESLPERVLDAVMEHHENVDGTGYPSKRGGDELGLMGQILSVADTLISLRVRRFAGSGRNLRDTQVILHIDCDAYREDVVTAAFRVLADCGVERTTFHPYESRERMVQVLHRRTRLMMGYASILSELPQVIPENRNMTPVLLDAFIRRLTHTLDRSGLSDGEIVKWMGCVAEGSESASLLELTELDLQQREILWQFRRLEMNLLNLAEKRKLRVCSPLRAVLETMTALREELEGDPSMGSNLGDHRLEEQYDRGFSESGQEVA